jgi:hypothetical protein
LGKQLNNNENYPPTTMSPTEIYFQTYFNTVLFFNKQYERFGLKTWIYDLKQAKTRPVSKKEMDGSTTIAVEWIEER